MRFARSTLTCAPPACLREAVAPAADDGPALAPSFADDADDARDDARDDVDAEADAEAALERVTRAWG